jgi:hypothetical protein
LFGVVGIAFIARIASLRVLADESGLNVRNFFRTQDFGWEEFEDFRLGRPMSGLPFGWVIHALLTSEEVVTLDVTASNWILAFGGRAKREQVLNTLREGSPGASNSRLHSPSGGPYADSTPEQTGGTMPCRGA